MNEEKLTLIDKIFGTKGSPHRDNYFRFLSLLCILVVVILVPPLFFTSSPKPVILDEDDNFIILVEGRNAHFYADASKDEHVRWSDKEAVKTINGQDAVIIKGITSVRYVYKDAR